MNVNVLNEAHGRDWSIYHADCVDFASQLPDESVDFSIYSPPFANLYIYSDSLADMGNCKSNDDFLDHYKFLIKEKLRVTVPGRLTAIHCKDLPAYYGSDGYSGLIDFPGMIIKAHEDEGWKYHSRVTIWKCPVTERERTNNNGLLHKSIMNDQSVVRQGMADYLIVMRKQPEDGVRSPKPIKKGGLNEYHGIDYCDPREENSYHPSRFARKKLASNDSINIWRRYAEPVWWDIDQQNVLNGTLATQDKDSKHICPLQLDVIKRAIQLWSMEGERVFSPFTGVGSEGVCSVQMKRKFIGTELKAEYFEHAIRFLKSAEAESGDLFDA